MFPIFSTIIPTKHYKCVFTISSEVSVPSKEDIEKWSDQSSISSEGHDPVFSIQIFISFTPNPTASLYMYNGN